jgi:hypothetical protein
VSRSVTYRFVGPFDESAVERLLERARREGLVFSFDAGRGDEVWFEGTPGKDLRALRKRIKAVIASYDGVWSDPESMKEWRRERGYEP